MRPTTHSSNASHPAQKTASFVAKKSSVPTKELFAWSAPGRPFKKRGKDFYTTVAAVAFLTGVILFLIEGFLPVIVIIALVFLIYVLTSVHPGSTEHKITNHGIIFGGKSYFWNELNRFWFTQRFGNDLLIVETNKIPGRLEMVIHPEDRSTIRQILQKFIDLEEASPNFMDKAASWFSKHIPLED